MEALGKNYPNSPMLATAVAVSNVMDEDVFLDEMLNSYKHKFASKPEVIEGNMNALKMTLEEINRKVKAVA